MIKRIATAIMTVAVSAFQSPAQAEMLADSGFRPKPNGFSFENWGGKQYPVSRLVPDDVRYLFGDNACARIEANLCVPTPGAVLWIDEMNRSTEGGHCEGMAALSASFFARLDSVDEFGARQTFALKPDNELLMRTISTYYTTQTLEPVQSATSATRDWPLQRIVDSLVKMINAGGDYPTLGIYFEGGGHAVTPYAVEARAKGQYRVHIYDNNYPGSEKYIDVDIPKDQWIYSGGALNPGEDPQAWRGKSGSMDITLLSVRNEPLKCPFCAVSTKPKPKPPGAARPKPKPSSASSPKPRTPSRKPVSAASRPGQQRSPSAQRKPGVAAQSYSVVTPTSCSQVQAIGRKSKKQIRMSASGVDSQITGASMRPLRGTRGCMLSLPPGEEYDVRLVNGSRTAGQASTSLSVFGAGRAWTVGNLSITSASTETFSVSKERFTYTAGSKQRPSMRVADSNNASNDYYEVSGFELNKGFEFSANEDEYGRMAFSDNDPDNDDFDVYAEVVGDEDTQTYEFEDISTGDDGQAMFDLAEDGALDMELDSDGDGEIDEVDEDFNDDDAGDSDTGDSDTGDADEESESGTDLDDEDEETGDAADDLGDDELEDNADYGDDEAEPDDIDPSDDDEDSSDAAEDESGDDAGDEAEADEEEEDVVDEDYDDSDDGIDEDDVDSGDDYDDSADDSDDGSDDSSDYSEDDEDSYEDDGGENRT